MLLVVCLIVFLVTAYIVTVGRIRKGIDSPTDAQRREGPIYLVVAVVIVVVLIILVCSLVLRGRVGVSERDNPKQVPIEVERSLPVEAPNPSQP